MARQITLRLPFNKRLDQGRRGTAQAADLAMHLRACGASQASSRRCQTESCACRHWTHSGQQQRLERPSAARRFVALKAPRCGCWSLGSVAVLAAARAAVGVAAVVGSDLDWVARRAAGLLGRRQQAQVELRLESRAGAIGG